MHPRSLVIRFAVYAAAVIAMAFGFKPAWFVVLTCLHAGLFIALPLVRTEVARMENSPRRVSVRVRAREAITYRTLKK